MSHWIFRPDGDGTRVEKSNGTIYWQGGLDESNLSGTLTNEYIFFGGQRIARRDPSSNVFYYFSDHLGTARSIAEVPSGQTTATKCYDADLYPFGGERWYSDTCDSHYKFTGKERDAESGLDYFGARYDASSLGRFMTPDPLGGQQIDPQTLNKYSYVGNNPLRYVDPNGEELVQLGQHTDDEIKKRTKEINQQLKDKNLSQAEKDKLKAEKKTLGLEKEGNAIGRSFLSALDKVGQRNGLQLSDLTITTDPKHDFAGQGLTQQQIDRITDPNENGFVLSRGGPIYLPTGSWLYANAPGNTEADDFGGTVLRHEQVHTKGGGEFDAFTVQRQVLQFFKNDFTPEHFNGTDEMLQRSIEENRPPQ